jgi:hypothetical protein
VTINTGILNVLEKERVKCTEGRNATRKLPHETFEEKVFLPRDNATQRETRELSLYVFSLLLYLTMSCSIIAGERR